MSLYASFIERQAHSGFLPEYFLADTSQQASRLMNCKVHPVMSVRGANEHETPRAQVHLLGLILRVISGLPLICISPGLMSHFLGLRRFARITFEPSWIFALSQADKMPNIYTLK